jgi:NADPH:quinone reductase-like Zn-dependent oxidoreductase
MQPSGAWAQLAAVSTEMLAQLPEAVSFKQASTIPVAGLTALRALEHGGLRELGADEVIDELAPGGETFDLVIDKIGGPVLGVAASARRAAGRRRHRLDPQVDMVRPVGGRRRGRRGAAGQTNRWKSRANALLSCVES